MPRIIIGQIALRHPRFAEIRALAAGLAKQTGATLGFRDRRRERGRAQHGGRPAPSGGRRHRGERQSGPMRTISSPSARAVSSCSASNPNSIAQMAPQPCQQWRTPISCWRSARSAAESLHEHADVILPTGTFAETSGTYVNVAGEWQSFHGIAQPLGESRPGWKILRVLGNLLEMPACEYDSSEAIRDELRERAANLPATVDLERAVREGLGCGRKPVRPPISIFRCTRSMRWYAGPLHYN